MRSRYKTSLVLVLSIAMVSAFCFLSSCSYLNSTSNQDRASESVTSEQPKSTDVPINKEVYPSSDLGIESNQHVIEISGKKRVDISTPPPVSKAETENSGNIPGPSQGDPDPDVEDLIRATEDPDWKVRWDAVNALGKLKDTKGIPALVNRALYDDNHHPRWRSLWALSVIDMEGSEAIPSFRIRLESTDPVLRRNAAVALAFFGQPEAIPELLKGLSDSDEYRRWEAVFSLRNTGKPEVIESLIPLLDETVEPEKRIRGEVALTLGRIGDERTVSALMDALRNDTSPDVRWRVALALSGLGDGSLVGELEQVLSVEEDPQVRESIEDAIASIIRR